MPDERSRSRLNIPGTASLTFAFANLSACGHSGFGCWAISLMLVSYREGRARGPWRAVAFFLYEVGRRVREPAVNEAKQPSVKRNEGHEWKQATARDGAHALPPGRR